MLHINLMELLQELYLMDPLPMQRHYHRLHMEQVAGTMEDLPMEIFIQDGEDDVSGSYFYFGHMDKASDTRIRLGHEALDDTLLRSKDFENTIVVPITEEGRDVYYHVASYDMASHLSSTAHIGPFLIDTTDPYYLRHSFPKVDTNWLIGTHLPFEWSAMDDLSGVDRYELYYSDPLNGKSNEVVGRYNSTENKDDLYLNPDIFLPTTEGWFELVVYDLAGNEESLFTSAYSFVSPFGNPIEINDNCKYGKVISGDIDNDGEDEFIVSGYCYGVYTIKSLNINGGIIVESYHTPAKIGGDLYLADYDRDGDLDLISGGYFIGEGRQIYIHNNGGRGNFVDPFRVELPDIEKLQSMVFRVADLNNTGEPILIYGGKGKIR